VAQVFVSLGSNIDRERHIDAALARLAASYGPLERSSIYESAAVGFRSAPFYNLVVGFETDQDPHELQEELHRIEQEHGRTRTRALAARTLDLDLLLYDDAVIAEESLRLPRPDITRYAFVLGPLAEIAGARRHPVTGKSFAEMWAVFDATDQELTRVPWPPSAAPG
jgi:2-amino-4-hydroxy-6-hydroxymethyldihydropteridine diphosphokinase